jgi:outer membrane protein TolC
MPRRMRNLVLGLAGAAVCGCTPEILHSVILPEQLTIDVHDPAPLPAVQVPQLPPPRTVSDPRPQDTPFNLSLDDALRIALVNAKVIRVLAGVSAVSSGSTIYDTAISLTNIDQQQARFDPVVQQNNSWNHIATPLAGFDPFDPLRARISATPTDDYRNSFGLNKTNLLGGQLGLNWVENPTRFGGGSVLPLNPQNHSAVELSYTQPLLQGGGFHVNTAPIVIARLDTERSYFQYKDSVQELVRGVIEAYWNLVFARTQSWARRIQVQQSEEAYRREEARLASGLASLANVAQSRVTYNQFKASLIAADADVLAREGALRNILGLPPEDDRPIVPVSVPTTQRLSRDWPALTRLAEQRRPDIVELKLILEADQVRMVQAQNLALPKLDLVGLYRWNGLDGELLNGDRVAARGGSLSDWTLGVNFSVPLGLRQARAAVRQQDLVILRDRANVEQGVHAALQQLAGTARDLDSAYEQYLVNLETRAAALDNLKVQIEEFRARRVIYLNVLQALNDWGNAVTSEAQALIGYNVALALLERQTGTILETHGLVFAEERFRAAGPLGWLCEGRDYPAALPPAGAPQRYPATDAPGENFFDLRNPDPREPSPDRPPMPRPLPPPGVRGADAPK